MQRVAAVLIGIIDDNIVLTKRSANLRSFTGHVCLPGGGFEPEYDCIASDAATREFNEELIFAGEVEQICCMLPEYSIVSSQVVYPVVARLDGIISAFNLDEVDKLIYLPITKLKQGLFSMNPQYPNIKHNKCFEHEGEFVWGLTAHILYKFMDILIEIEK